MSWMEYLLDNRFAVRGVALLTDKSNSNGRGKGDGNGNGKKSGKNNGQKDVKGKNKLKWQGKRRYRLRQYRTGCRLRPRP